MLAHHGCGKTRCGTVASTLAVSHQCLILSRVHSNDTQQVVVEVTAVFLDVKEWGVTFSHVCLGVCLGIGRGEQGVYIRLGADTHGVGTELTGHYRLIQGSDDTVGVFPFHPLDAYALTTSLDRVWGYVFLHIHLS